MSQHSRRRAPGRRQSRRDLSVPLPPLPRERRGAESFYTAPLSRTSTASPKGPSKKTIIIATVVLAAVLTSILLYATRDQRTAGTNNARRPPATQSQTTPLPPNQDPSAEASMFSFDTTNPGAAPTTSSSIDTPIDPAASTGPELPVTSREPSPTPGESVPNAGPSVKAMTDPPSSNAIPTPARSAGFTRFAFGEEFTSSESIDLSGTGSGSYKWYTDLPGGRPTTPRSTLSISDSVLTINQAHETRNFTLLTTSAHTDRGTAFRHGYFEARLAFDATRAAGSTGWPSISLISRNYVSSRATAQMGEISVFEAAHQERQPFANIFHGTLNQGDWRGGTPHHAANYGANFKPMPEIDFTKFHTYSALWQPGSVTWYFDHKLVFTQRYSATRAPNPNPRGLPAGTFNILDTNPSGMTLVLGTGVGQPLHVDWVRVWQ